MAESTPTAARIVLTEAPTTMTREQTHQGISNLMDCGVNTLRVYGAGFNRALGTDMKTMVCRDDLDDKMYGQLIGGAPFGYMGAADNFDTLMKVKKSGVIERVAGNIYLTPENMDKTVDTIKKLNDNGIHAAVECGRHDQEHVFDESNRRDLDKLGDKLFFMYMEHGAEIRNSTHHTNGIADYAIKGCHNCSLKPTHLDVAPDGSMVFCKEIRGDVSKQHNIQTLTPTKLKQFMHDRIQEYYYKGFACNCSWSVYADTAGGLDTYFLENRYTKKEEKLK